MFYYAIHSNSNDITGSLCTCSNSDTNLKCLHNQSQECKSRVQQHNSTSTTRLISHVCHLQWVCYDLKVRIHATNAVITSCCSPNDIACCSFATESIHDSALTTTSNDTYVFLAFFSFFQAVDRSPFCRRNISRAVRK